MRCKPPFILRPDKPRQGKMCDASSAAVRTKLAHPTLRPIRDLGLRKSCVMLVLNASSMHAAIASHRKFIFYLCFSISVYIFCALIFTMKNKK